MGEPAPARPAGPWAGPRQPGWADVRAAMITAGQLTALAATQAAARPGNPALLDMLGLAVDLLEGHGEIARRAIIDESILEAREREAYARGVADCKAARCRLGVVPPRR